MPSNTPASALARLRNLYRDAFKVPLDSVTNDAVIAWAQHPEHWATIQIRHRGWSWHAAEAVVRQCRILLKRATIAAEAAALAAAAEAEAAGIDRFDPLMPCVDGSCTLIEEATDAPE